MILFGRIIKRLLQIPCHHGLQVRGIDWCFLNNVEVAANSNKSLGLGVVGDKGALRIKEFLNVVVTSSARQYNLANITAEPGTFFV